MNALQKTDALIIGGGISGLCTAFFLREKGVSVRLLEKSARPGGVIRSVCADGFLYEYGPNSSLDTTPLLHELIQKLNLQTELLYAGPQAKNRYILRKGELLALPMGPLAFLKTPLFSWKAKMGLLREPFVPPRRDDGDESLAGFVRRRLGEEFLDYAIDPFVAGVYAGLPEKLSVRSAFPKLYALEENYGSLIRGAVRGARERRKRAEASKQSAQMFSFRSGMEVLVRALAEKLKEQVETGARISAVRRNENGFELLYRSESGSERSVSCRHLIFTVPAYALSEMPFEFDFPLARALKEIDYSPVAVVFWGFRENPANRPLNGFGFLAPRKENRQILGSIWNSRIFPDRAPKGGVAMTTFIGGSRQPNLAVLPEDDLENLVRNDLQEILGISRQPDFRFVHKWARAIPQYNLGHRKIMEKITMFEERHPGIYISGNFRGGISLTDCIKNAGVLAGRISREISAPAMMTQ